MTERDTDGSEPKFQLKQGARKQPVYLGGALLGYRATPEHPRRKRRYQRGIHQLRELERLIKHRHGVVIPETDDGVIYGEVAAIMHLIIDRDSIEKSFPAWCRRWMPWANAKIVEQLLYEDLRPHHQMPSDDALGHMLRLTFAERAELDIRGLGSHDVTKRERAKLQASKRREQDRARKRKMRRQTGSKPRSEYEAQSLSKRSPWRDEGISRRTWYRRNRHR